MVASDAGGAESPQDSGQDWQDDLRMILEISSIEANCAPPVAVDPLDVFYGIQYGNHSDARISIIVAESRVVLRKEAAELAWSFAVDQRGPFLEPEGVVGAIVSQGYNKLDGSGAGTGNGLPCDYCEAPVSLEVLVAVRGETVLLTDADDYYGNPMHLGCAFE